MGVVAIWDSCKSTFRRTWTPRSLTTYFTNALQITTIKMWRWELPRWSDRPRSPHSVRNRCWIWLHFEGGTLGTTVAEAAVEGSQMEAAEWRKIQGLSFHQCRTFSQSVIQNLRSVHDFDENSFVYMTKNVKWCVCQDALLRIRIIWLDPVKNSDKNIGTRWLVFGS